MRTLIAAIAFLSVNAHAQTAVAPEVPTVPVALQVQRLAPQLVAFAGSQGNFENLVNGLALGVPVTLSSIGANNIVQTVTFALPGGAVSEPGEIARVLEGARQQLIARGIAAPTAQQLGEQISGTTVPVAVGTVAPQPSGAAAAGSTASPSQQIQSRSAPGAPGAPQVNTSDSRIVGNTSDSPVTAPSATTVPQPPAPPVGSSPDLGSAAVPPPAAVAPAPVTAPPVSRSPDVRR